MIMMPLSAAVYFSLQWGTSADHRILPAVISAVAWAILMLGYYAWLRRSSRE